MTNTSDTATAIAITAYALVNELLAVLVSKELITRGQASEILMSASAKAADAVGPAGRDALTILEKLHSHRQG